MYLIVLTQSFNNTHTNIYDYIFIFDWWESILCKYGAYMKKKLTLLNLGEQ